MDDGRMNGPMDGRAGEWMDRWVNGGMIKGCMNDGWMNGHGWMSGWMERWTDGWKDELMDG